MKKTISITISGIIFHIEDDGYDQLRQYLDGIKHYFASFDNNKEIVDDIESRVAEIFLQRLKSGKQVIDLEDIKHLQETLGTTKDFTDLQEEGPQTEPHGSSASAFEAIPMDKLYRNTIGRVIGGVAAGMGIYFRADPVWFRILFLSLLLIPIFSFVPGFISFMMFLTYIVLWIVLPGRAIFQDQQPKGVKKLYRDPDAKVLGGVSSGLGKYFGTDVTVIRLIFLLLLIPFLLGLIIYVILWMIVPQARTLTEKLQMEGEPVTIGNIENSLKKSIQPVGKEEETTLTKIVLFPFRAIAAILSFLVKILLPIANFLVDAIRVLAGLILTFIGLSIILSTVAAGAVFGGFFAGFFDLSAVDIEALKFVMENLSGWIVAALFLLLSIPGLALIISGISVIAKKNLWNKWLGWILLGIFLIAFTLFTILGIKGDYNFQLHSDKEYKQELSIIDKIPVLKLDANAQEEIENFTVKLQGYDGSGIDIRNNASIIYAGNRSTRATGGISMQAVVLADSILLLPLELKMTTDEKMKVIKQELTVKIPFEKPFVMDKNLVWALRNTMTRSSYKTSMIDNNTIWVFDPEGILRCVSCGDWEPRSMETLNQEN